LPDQTGFTSPQFFEPPPSRPSRVTPAGTSTPTAASKPPSDSASARKTRPLAIVGLIGYGAYLAGNALRNR
jgi:hypothetical protein